jgi:hypothetical protein
VRISLSGGQALLKGEKAEVTVALKEGTRRCQQRSSSGFAWQRWGACTASAEGSLSNTAKDHFPDKLCYDSALIALAATQDPAATSGERRR